MKITASTTPTSNARLNPFKFTREEWPEDAETTKLKINAEEGSVGFDNKMKILHGTESPELFIRWKHEYDRRILDHPTLTMISKRQTLLQLLKGDALTVVNKSMDACVHATVANRKFTKYALKTKVDVLHGAARTAYFGATNEAYLKDCLMEFMHVLKIKIFGDDIIGKSSYTKLRKQIRTTKVDMKKGIKRWDERIQELQTYLPDCLWEAGEARGKELKPFEEFELREILEGNLTQAQQLKLYDVNWDIHEKNYGETISKLEGLEASILGEAEVNKRLVMLENNKTNKHSGSNNGNGKRGRSPATSGSNTPKGKRVACKTCGKMHQGKCWSLTGGPPKRPRFDKETINMLREAIRAGSDDESEDSRNSWGNGMSKGEYSYVLGAAQHEMDVSDDELSIDKENLKKYKKKYRKAFGSKKSSKRK